jgi:peptidylprolyl isomerase
VLDSSPGRGSAATKRAAATSSRGNTAGQPLKSKADRRAEAKATKARARTMRKRRRALTVAGAAAAVLALVIGLFLWAGDSPSEPAGTAQAPATKPVVTAGTGTVTELKTTTLVEGTGAAVQPGQTISVHYAGVTYADGKEFDSSWDRSEPFSFAIGAGKVIQGWDKGLLGVKVGSRVQLDIPSEQAYGDNPGGGRPAGAIAP